MYKTVVSYPKVWDSIIDVVCFDETQQMAVKTYSNFNGDFNSVDVEKFCEEMASKGIYTRMNVHCWDCN